MKNHFLNQRLLVNIWKIYLLTFLVWASLARATPASSDFTATSITAGGAEKANYRLTTRLSAIGPESDKFIEIASTPETVEVNERLNDSSVRKKKKKSGQVVSLPGFAGLPLPEEKRESDLYRGGYLGQDDDDSFKRPPYFPIQNKGDFTLTLLPVLRIPTDWRNYLKGSHWYHWVMGEPDHDSGVTLHIRFNDSSPTVLHLSQAEFRQLTAYLGSSQQLLKWLAPKLRGREEFIHFLMDMAAGLSVQDENSLQQIEKQIDTLAEWPDHEFNLEFEWEQLEQTLAGSDNFKDMTITHEPDTETVYEGEDINKLIYQTMFSWLRGSKKTGATGSGSGNREGSGQEGAGRSGIGGNAKDDEGSERFILNLMQQRSSNGSPPTLRIVFTGAQNVGKSSLGNRLIGWEPFKRTVIYNKKPDPIYRFQDVEIRTTKGYGRSGGEEYIKNDYLGAENIEQNDVIIFLFDKDLTGYDLRAIEALVKNGNRIIFVCNKVDTCTDKIGDKKEIKSEFKANLEENGIQDTPKLIFTCSQSNSKNGEEITKTKELEKEILSVLKTDEKAVFEKYLKTRMRPDEKTIKISEERIEKGVKEYNGQSSGIEEIKNITVDAIKEGIHPDIMGPDNVDELNRFNDYFQKISGHIESITRDDDHKLFLRACNNIVKVGLPEVAAGAAGATLGTIGTLFGPLGTVAGVIIGSLVGVCVARITNLLYHPHFNLRPRYYEECKKEIQSILYEKRDDELSLYRKKVFSEDGNTYADDPETKKIEKKYEEKVDKFYTWADKLPEHMRSATSLFRELFEKIFQHYQRLYDEAFFAKTSVTFLVPYDEIRYMKEISLIQSDVPPAIYQPERGLHLMTCNTGLMPSHNKNDLRSTQQRYRKIAGALTRNPDITPDVVCFQEAFVQQATEQLCQDLKGHYHHIVHSVAPRKTGLNSGLVIASKYPVKVATFRPFTDLVEEDRRINKGLLRIVLDLGNDKTAVVYNTHLQASEGQPYEAIRFDQSYQIRKWFEEDSSNDRRNKRHHHGTFLMGDLNFARSDEQRLCNDPEYNHNMQALGKDFSNTYYDTHDEENDTRLVESSESFFVNSDQATINPEDRREPDGTRYRWQEHPEVTRRCIYNYQLVYGDTEKKWASHTEIRQLLLDVDNDLESGLSDHLPVSVIYREAEGFSAAIAGLEPEDYPISEVVRELVDKLKLAYGHQPGNQVSQNDIDPEFAGVNPLRNIAELRAQYRGEPEIMNELNRLEKRVRQSMNPVSGASGSNRHNRPIVDNH
ncbi:endonuclease/exonuclease/phosphatase family protein [Endozoicomonas sp. SESOKO4]|uniref:endonuclease/exonuclease/phosphatase family protein n=2 Tax=unclassified Endozoicomonas TaxID=2644528 RepID=UPI0021495E44|nr:endonuclease/exonuclease/phosphatase family protein [Endozoicomonas sp. SESOKO4]